MRTRTTLHRSLLVAVGSLLVLAVPAAASWSVSLAPSSTGAAAAKGAPTASISAVVVNDCSGNSHKLDVKYTTSAPVATSSIVRVWRGSTAAVDTSGTPMTAQVTSPGVFTDANASNSNDNYYKIQVAIGSNWTSLISSAVGGNNKC